MHNLVCVILVEREASAGIYDFAFRVAMAAKDEPAVFRSFVVVEEHPGLGPIERLLLPSHDNARKFGVIGDHHSQRSIRLDQIDSLDSNLPKRAVA
ncbi:MAG TPA: hypothetical protein VNX66_00635 [Candidatus Sulfotelmatobacter sp.]|nr:hypothetical protein [Candidatus Sulfotelmatobacter sp.]